MAEFQDLVSFLDQELVFIIHVSSLLLLPKVGGSHVSECLIPKKANCICLFKNHLREPEIRGQGFQIPSQSKDALRDLQKRFKVLVPGCLTVP